MTVPSRRIQLEPAYRVFDLSTPAYAGPDTEKLMDTQSRMLVVMPPLLASLLAFGLTACSGQDAEKMRSGAWEHVPKVKRHMDHAPFFSEAIEDGPSATKACLKCHGEPKGAKDITGGKKEGGKLGELGGAISFVLYK